MNPTAEAEEEAVEEYLKELVHVIESAGPVIRCANGLAGARGSYGLCRWSSEGRLGQCRVVLSDSVECRSTMLVLRGKIEEECRGPGARNSGSKSEEVAETGWICESCIKSSCIGTLLMGMTKACLYRLCWSMKTSLKGTA